MGFNQMGFGTKTQALNSQEISLTGGQAYTLPTGQYTIVLGPLTFLQVFDPTIQNWRTMQTPVNSDIVQISSDGYNYRLFNATGTVVGAIVTTGGSGYTNGIFTPTGVTIPGAVVQAGTAAAPSVTMSAGGGTVLSAPTIIVGGVVNTTLTLSTVVGTSGTFTAGSGYTRAPNLIVSAPPPGGVPCTMTCTISGSAVNAVTVTNAGAGYTSAPTVTVVNHTFDTSGTGATVTANTTLAQSGAIAALIYQNGGVGHTSVPTFTFAPASTSAATAIMCFTITAGVLQTAASNMGTGNIGFAGGALTAGSNTTTNPAITTGLFVPRMAYTAFNTTATGGITFLDGGLHQIIPTGIAYAVLSNGTISAAATAVAQTVGGATDTSVIIAF